MGAVVNTFVYYIAYLIPIGFVGTVLLNCIVGLRRKEKMTEILSRNKFNLYIILFIFITYLFGYTLAKMKLV